MSKIYDIINDIGEDMSFNLKESGFNENLESTNNIPLSGLVYLNHLENINKLDTFKLNESMFMLYDQFKTGGISSFSTGLQVEAIKSYFGTKYCDEYDMYGDIANKKSLKNLFNILDKDVNNHISDNTKSSLLHIFNELDRNVRNHSGYMDRDKKNYYYSFIIYPNSNKLHMTILDDGQGISQSLRKASDPIECSVREGMSAHSNWMYTDDFGRNSGYGLYLCNELSKKNHCLEIVDNGEYYTSDMKQNVAGITKVANSNFIKGVTMVNVIVDLDTIEKDLAEVQINSKSKSSKSNLIHLDMDRVRKISKVNKQTLNR